MLGKFQLPAGGLDSALDRFPTSGQGMYLSFEEFQLPAGGLRSEYQTLRDFLVRGLSSTLVESIIFRPEDHLLHGWEKC